MIKREKISVVLSCASLMIAIAWEHAWNGIVSRTSDFRFGR
ncbi:MAG: hypothetical protein CM1200mP30_34060 [Pseudomonadota bacterium]|nr:MAG: hypothetical protein CM1200mP30_34060 [Pseudomonadota bacterium]